MKITNIAYHLKRTNKMNAGALRIFSLRKPNEQSTYFFLHTQ